MTNQKHQIRRQVFEFTVPNEASGARLHALLPSIQSDIEALIDACCSEVSSPDRVHRMGKVEVDLGELRGADLERVLVEKLRPALREALEAKVRLVELEAVRLGEDPATNARLELISLFARTATLPFWADAADPALVDATMAWLLQRDPGQTCMLVRWLARDRRALDRLVRHVAAERLLSLFKVLVDPRGSRVSAARATELWELLGASRGVQPKVPTTLVWVAALEVVSLHQERASVARAFLRDVLERVTVAAKVPLVQLATELRRELRGTHASVLADVLEDEVRAWGGPIEAADLGLGRAKTSPEGKPRDDEGANHVSERGARDDEGADEGANHVSEREARDDEGADEGANHVSEREAHGDEGAKHFSERTDPRAKHSELSPPRTDPDEVYLDGVGVVLLWPFLQTFFGRLGLLEGAKSFVDDMAQSRGVLLVHYLATGEVDPPEFRLPLPKVLCGLAPEDIVDRDVVLSEAEVAEGERLLAAAVAHAKNLGSIEPVAFRETFLRRRGVLSVRDGAWHVRVERAAYDVVLERLPWIVQWIRLPWMREPLFVEWIR